MVWKNMRKRCNNQNDPQYADYGGRGISICPEWGSFEQFLADMGECNGLTIERKDVNGNYCKENCCWIPRAAQRRNTRHTHQITWGGQTKPLNYWAKELGITGTALKYRIAKWGLESAMTTPLNHEKQTAGQASMEHFKKAGFARTGNCGRNFSPLDAALDSHRKSSLARWTGRRKQRVPRS